MYLKGRDPLVVNSNPFFVLEEDPTPSRNSQVSTISRVCFRASSSSSVMLCVCVCACVYVCVCVRFDMFCVSVCSALFANSRAVRAGFAQIERATSLIISCLKFHQAVISGTLEADNQRGQALCMAQYSMLFHATRIPGEFEH